MNVPDEPHPQLTPPINDRTSTVFAPAVALSGPDGQIRAGGRDGLYVNDLRVLTEARLRLGGDEPHHLGRGAEGPGRVRFVAIVPSLGDGIADPTVRVDRRRRVTPDGMREEIRISSTAGRAVRTVLTVDVRCDLAPLPVIRSGRSAASVFILDRPATVGPGSRPSLVWRHGSLTVEAGADGGAVDAEAGTLSWPVDLEPRGEVTLVWWVRVAEPAPQFVAATGPVEWSRPRVRCDDARLARMVEGALDDLESLRLSDGASTFLAAGAPWYLTLFGRDSIWAARMLLPLGTSLAEGTLWTLARRQGTVVDELSCEAPGKIMHELRPDDPEFDRTAQLRQGGSLPSTYYGTVDATMLWISLLADAWRWGLPDASVTPLLPHLRRALEWLERYADPDGDGFVEYIDTTGRGLANQGWKDSGDAVRFHSGAQAVPPISLCEVQGYAHRAALDGAELLAAFGGGPHEAEAWRGYAADLAVRFRDRFWVSGPLGPFPAMALDGEGRPVDALTSNIGHLLGTGILDADEERIVARLLGSVPLAGGYGIRTMSTLDNAYAPLSYHCGSVWPHDTAIALLGLAGAGAAEPAATAVSGLLAAAEAFEYRLPELYGGDGRDELSRPVPYPDACRPQAWSAAAAVAILQATLGLSAHVPRGEVRVEPLVGRDLGALEVRGLRIGGHAVDVALDRDGRARVSGLPPYLRLVEPARAPEPASAPAPEPAAAPAPAPAPEPASAPAIDASRR